MTPMRVIEVSTCPHTSRPMVMLQVEGRDRWLAFYIPMNEANRLARCLGMTSCPCTPIFELTEQLIGHLQAEVRRAHLEGDERGISAGIVLERDGLEMLHPLPSGRRGGAGGAGGQAHHGPRQRAGPRALRTRLEPIGRRERDPRPPPSTRCRPGSIRSGPRTSATAPAAARCNCPASSEVPAPVRDDSAPPARIAPSRRRRAAARAGRGDRAAQGEPAAPHSRGLDRRASTTRITSSRASSSWAATGRCPTCRPPSRWRSSPRRARSSAAAAPSSRRSASPAPAPLPPSSVSPAR